LKTGTSDNFKDATTIAFTPDIAAVLWIGDILDFHHTMLQGYDSFYVAAPGMHAFIEAALIGLAGNRWYSKPPDVVAGPNNSWYLSDTTNIGQLPGDNPPSPTPVVPVISVPPDPGGPVLASPPPSPTPSGLPIGG
jgi:membrane peptidoglycan carboxypeptidase